jgi:ATP-dependent DNA helicase RecG
MQREELERLLLDLESDRVERTVSATKTDKFCEAICAFSNDMPNNRQPGYLFIGANPDGSASGLKVDDRLLLQLRALRTSGTIIPLPAMNVQKFAFGGGEMAVVEVLPSDMPPVRYKGQVYIRTGPARDIASESQERILMERRTSSARTWDMRPERGAQIEDLVLDLFTVGYRPFAVSTEVIAENHRDIPEQLAGLRFYDLRSAHPTNAAILLFAKDPLYFVPGAYVQYVHYDGPDRTARVVRERRLSGDLLTVMRGLDQLAQDVAGTHPVQGPGLADRLVHDYPPRALHELFINAVIHRNYDGSTTPVTVYQFSDRIEVLNPGGLYGDLTREQFPNGSAYRNPVLAECAHHLGFVNRYNRGIALVQAELQRNGSPPVEFAIESNFFLATVRQRSEG